VIKSVPQFKSPLIVPLRD